MPQEIFSIPDSGDHQTFTGERYTIGTPGDIQNEHYHRYLFSLRFCEGLDVLDVASGEGYGTALLATVARSVVGVDIDEGSVAFAARTYIRDNLSFRPGSAFAIPLEDACVDAVISFETIEHVGESIPFLKEVRRVLRPGGLFVVSTPDRRVYSEETGYTNPFHLNELSREEFWALLVDQFPNVRMFEQQVVAGSIISMIGDTTHSTTESFVTTDGQTFKRTDSLPNAPYLVAVASVEPTYVPTVSVLHGLWTDAASGARPIEPSGIPSSAGTTGTAEQTKAMNAEITDLRGRLFDANLASEKITRELLDLDHERGFLRTMLTSARSLADGARAELVHVRAVELASATEVAAIRKNAEIELQAVAARARAAADKEVATQGAHFAAQLDVIRRSTSWRVSWPLRAAKTMARRILRRDGTE